MKKKNDYKKKNATDLADSMQKGYVKMENLEKVLKMEGLE